MITKVKTLREMHWIRINLGELKKMIGKEQEKTKREKDLKIKVSRLRQIVMKCLKILMKLQEEKMNSKV